MDSSEFYDTPTKKTNSEAVIEAMSANSMFTLQTNFDILPNYEILAYDKKYDPQRKVYVKMFLGMEDKQEATIALLDSGANCCCIHYDLLKRMFKDTAIVNSKIRKVNTTISGFSGSKVKVMGLITLKVKFSQESSPIPVHFFVIDLESKNLTNCIIGISAHSYMDLELTFYRVNGRKLPHVFRRTSKEFINVETFYLNTHEVNNIQKSVMINPGKVETLELEVPDYMNLDINNHYLIQGGENKNGLSIVPSASVIDTVDGKNILKATVYNHSKKLFRGKLNFHIENIAEAEVVPINQENREYLKGLRTLHEVLVIDDDENLDSTFVYDGSSVINKGKEFPDLDMSQLIFEPSTEPNVSAISAPSFPEGEHIYDPTADNNNCEFGESLSDNKLKGNIEISPPDPNIDFSGSDTIKLGLQHPDPSTLQDLTGFSLPEKGHDKIVPADIIKLENYDEEIRPYIKDIFLDSYPEVISTHSYDLGNLSSLLGYYTLKLKKGARLPRHSKLYYLSPADSQQMKDILEFMEKFDIITRCPQGGDEVKLCCSAYLIARKDKQAAPRMIVNYIPVNRLTDYEPPVIPTCIDTLNKLRDSTYFSSVDLTGAFNSIYLDPSCRHLTSFITQHGQFYSNRLITGGIGSPGVLHRFVNRVLNYKPKRDKYGKIIWTKESLAELTWDPILGCHVYFDDIIIYSPFINSHEESRDYHFNLVKKVMERLSIFKGKISIQKSVFFKTKITFLGWNITHNFVTPDPKRIDKVINYPIPTSTKQWRQFLGVLNSCRQVLGFSVLKHVSKLSELTSDKISPTDLSSEQIKAFNDIKLALTSGPLYANLIDPHSKKIVYSDAAVTAGGSVGSVLCQLAEPKKGQKYLPTYLHMADKCHRLIQKYDIKCVPVRFIKENEDRKEFLKIVGPNFPPETSYLEDPTYEMGDQIENSMTLCLKTLFSLHSMSTEKSHLLNIGEKCVKFLKKDIVGQQIKTYHCKGSTEKFYNYLDKVKNFRFDIDKDFCIFDCLGMVLSRPIVVISSLSEHKEDPIFRFRTDLSRPPFFFLIYEVSNKIVAKTAYYDKEQVFDMASLRGKFEICAYYTHVLPKVYKSWHIMELEAIGIVLSLQNFEKLIGSSDCLLISDSKCLYYMWNQEIQQSSDKVSRWSNKIFSKFPNLKVTFCKSAQNIADLLTRVYNAKPTQFKMTNVDRLATFVDDKIFDKINMKTFSLEEWSTFCKNHPEFLIKSNKTTPKDTPESKGMKPKVTSEVNSKIDISEINSKDEYSHLTIHEIEAGQDPNVISGYVNLTEAIDRIKNKFSAQIIGNLQRLELEELYNELLLLPDNKKTSGRLCQFLHNGLIYRTYDDKNAQIIIPSSLIDAVIAYVHLSCAHSGRDRMMMALSPYYCKGLRKRVDNFCRTCINCLLNNYNTVVQKYGMYPVINSPFYSIHIDFISDLTECEGYKHLLVVIDSFTLVSFAIPFKTAESKEFVEKFVYHVVQLFRPAILHCDNAMTFMAQETLEILSSLKVRIVHSVPNNAYSFGQQESYIKVYRTAMRKFMTPKNKENWLFIPVLISNKLNSHINCRHKSKPFELLFGKSRFSENYDNYLQGETLLHPVIAKEQEDMTELAEKWESHLKEIEKVMNNERESTNKALNKYRKNKDFPPGAIVFVKRVNPRSFETVYVKSVYMVVQERISTCLIIRIADGYMILCHKNNMKRYDPNIEMFNTLPNRIKDLCLKIKDEPKLSKRQFNIFIDFDEFEIPKNVLNYMYTKDPQEILNEEFGYADPDDPQPGSSNDPRFN